MNALKGMNYFNGGLFYKKNPMKSQIHSSIKPLWFTGALLLFMYLAQGDVFASTSNSYYKGTIRINPECKLLRMSNGDVVITAKNQEGIEVKHRFTDFYADLLLAAYRKQRLEYIVNSLGKKFYLSEEECRREIKHAVQVLMEWKIVLVEDQIALH